MKPLTGHADIIHNSLNLSSGIIKYKFSWLIRQAAVQFVAGSERPSQQSPITHF